MVQSITMSAGPVIAMAVETGGLDIPALMRHAAIQGSIVGLFDHSQFSAQRPRLCCDGAAAVERVNEANAAHNLKCRVLTEAAGDAMRRDCHLDTQMGAGKTTRGLLP